MLKELLSCLQGKYFTIHITPQPDCSYVSFETNYPQKDYRGLINKVLRIFKPGRVLLTLFANQVSGNKGARSDNVVAHGQ